MGCNFTHTLPPCNTFMATLPPLTSYLFFRHGWRNSGTTACLAGAISLFKWWTGW